MTDSAQKFDLETARLVKANKASTLTDSKHYIDQRPYAAIQGRHAEQEGFWVVTYPAGTHHYDIPSSRPEGGDFFLRDQFFARFTDEFFQLLSPAAAARVCTGHFNDAGCKLSDPKAIPKIFGRTIHLVDNITSDGFYAKIKSRAVEVKRGQLAVLYKDASCEVMNRPTASSRLFYWEDQEQKYERWPEPQRF